MNSLICNTYFRLALGFMCVGVVTFSQAAPGTLSNIPLYMGDGAQPNVLWLLDDSGSMNSEVTKRVADVDDPGTNTDDSQTGYEEIHYGGFNNICDDDGHYCNLDYDTVVDGTFTKEDLLKSCFHYSTSAYNPDAAYLPWTNADGSLYPNSVFTNARKDPTDVSAGTKNLTNAKYIVGWDFDDDNKFDKGECWEDVDDGPAVNDDRATADIRPDMLLAVSNVRPNYVLVNTLSTSEQQNYANWYTYYRKRTFALKAALSDAIAQSDQNFGLATINEDGNAAFEIADMTNSTNKTDMMDKLINVDTDGGTPLVSALLNAGKYFNRTEDPDSDFVDSSGNPANPIQYSCQANYTVLMTDGFRNQDNANSVFPYDKDTDTNNSSADGNAFNGAPYGDGIAGTMADIAMHYYSMDLDTNIANEVRTGSSIDTNTAQHMVTHAITFGVTGNLLPDTDYSLWDQTTTGANRHYWPTVIGNNSRETLDDLFHATVNGRGLFFNSDSPAQLKADIQSILDAIAFDTAGTAASVGFNSTSISAGALLYQAWFNTADWSGTLKAYDFSSGTVTKETYNQSGNIVATNDLTWDAADILNARDISSGASPRVLLTYSSTQDTDGDTSTAEGSGINFDPPADYTLSVGQTVTTDNKLNDKHLSDLLLHSHVVAASTTADKQAALVELVDWFKGDRSIEGAGLRTRGSRLGDIVHSSPQYVGAPSAPYPNNIQGSNLYSDFITAKSGRTALVYVGSNDGMLHAFNAANGSEVFAYIPELLFDSTTGLGLRQVAEPTYDHLPFQDGTPTVADVYVNSAWKSYLVSGLNGGGKGFYILDVTNPVSYIANNLEKNIPVGEFTHANMGYTFARPQIAKMNNGKWAAIIGNGYNNTGHGQSSIFIYYLDGSGFKEIATGKGAVANGDCADASSDCNGMSSPSLVDLDGDYIVDRIYAGDVHGYMWAFDVSSTSPSSWDVAHQDSGADVPLFIACRGTVTSGVCPAADRQPITSKPVVVAHQTETGSSTEPNLMVTFGTGQMVAVNDQSTTDPQSFYAVWDAGSGYNEIERDQLAANTIGTATVTTGTGVNATSLTARTITEESFNYDESVTNTAGFGWYIDLPTSGERVVLTPLVTGSLISFVTTIPSPGICTSNGSGWLMAVDMFTGDQPSSRIFNDVNSAVAGVPLDNMSGGMITIDNKYVGADSIGDIIVEDASWQSDRPSRRASWSIIR